MKEGIKKGLGRHCGAYPKVAPEPNMYLPSVRMTPLGPAPYWKIVTVPALYELTEIQVQVGFSFELESNLPIMKPIIPPTAKGGESRQLE